MVFKSKEKVISIFIWSFNLHLNLIKNIILTHYNEKLLYIINSLIEIYIFTFLFFQIIFKFLIFLIEKICFDFVINLINNFKDKKIKNIYIILIF